jgi:single-strand DNA-binding protein
MFYDPQVYLTGYLVQEPRFKKVSGDISCVELRVAYTPRRRNSQTGAWSDKETMFVNVQCWRHLADNVTTCLRKGEPVLVMGRLQVRNYKDGEGKSRVAVEIDATSIGHDLNRGMAHFFRASRSAGRTAAEAAADGEPDSGDVAEPGEMTAAAVGGGAAPGGDGVVDEQAVAEFARQLSALGPDGVADDEDGTGVTESSLDAETESVTSTQS